MNIALILSGGVGTRFGYDTPKQYLEVGGRPLFDYSLKAFEEHGEVSVIQIVAEKAWRPLVKAWSGTKLRGFSEPGANRQLSILNGLTDIMKYAADSDTVIIHDAARPSVSKELISSCLDACKTHEGAVPTVPVKDTVYVGDGKRITSLLDRRYLYAGQAPEAFRLGAYYSANLALLPNLILTVNGSAEPAVMAGMDIVMTAGEEENYKITTREDLKRFRQENGERRGGR